MSPDARFEAACARAGLAATEQRRLIYKALAESHDHPTAEAVFLEIRPKAPRLSLATVYRNLRLFAAAGLVTRSRPAAPSHASTRTRTRTTTSSAASAVG